MFPGLDVFQVVPVLVVVGIVIVGGVVITIAVLTIVRMSRGGGAPDPETPRKARPALATSTVAAAQLSNSMHQQELQQQINQQIDLQIQQAATPPPTGPPA